jgi:cell division protein FtsQ
LWKSWEGKEGERSLGVVQKIFRGVCLLLVASALLYAGHEVYARLMEETAFRLKDVEVRGCEKLSRETIVCLSGIEEAASLFQIRLGEVIKRLDSHPWVEQASVRKVFPDRIVIEIKERRPLAIVQLDELCYIDGKGVIFSKVGDGDGYNYPFLTGVSRSGLEKEPEGRRLLARALELLRVIEEKKKSPLGEISEIHMDRDLGLDCYSRTEGLEVRLGWGQFDVKLARLSQVWSDLQNRGVSAAAIDCTDLKQVVVRPGVRRPGPEVRIPGKAAAPVLRAASVTTPVAPLLRTAPAAAPAAPSLQRVSAKGAGQTKVSVKKKGLKKRDSVERR